MYLTHFGLKQLPFGMTPDPDFFFTGNKRGEILAALLYALEQGDGIIKVTGEVGSGKTMLCRMLESRLPAQIEVIYLVNPTLTREQVMYTIAGELELPIQGKRADEVIRMLHVALIEKHIHGKQVVLLVEEAQAMSLETLEEIRLFSNLETAHHKLLQIVLFGQPELDVHLNLTRMRQLRERITNSFKVPPLTSTNLPEYLKFRLRAAGYHGPDLFSSGAAGLIGQVSKGIVRRISILADKALLAAFADNANTVMVKHVRAAIRDSEFSQPVFTRMRVAISVALLLLLTLGWLGWHFSAPRPAVASPAVKVLARSAPAVTVLPVSPAKPLPVTPAATETPVVQSAVLPRPSTFDQRLLLSKSWLEQQSSDHYSIQLALIASLDQAEMGRILYRLETEMGLEHIYVYTSSKNSAGRIGVLYGSYASRAEALSMLDQLTLRWGYRAQLRTIGGIKKEITAS